MNKLTAEKCRNKIEHFKEVSKTWQLSIEAEYTLQALEIALPILEQQERGEWIEWKGGECPVEYQKSVGVKLRGDVETSDTASAFYWHHGGDRGDIIAYRIIPEQPTNQNGEQ
jgi:hypothetical protein